ncbi:uncharacterized protein LOC128883205 isoform X2 [Hylaeus volcanicus]|uniref:uncharacterized protein LOC128883205 isoform X2 n=1 Tax=Hylaeus volcanicus TaxID=313075 RepID=UPI0023B79E19|nr:uncharacterized protein LOC128883205 isoform X2 [Hylaeus volcanicus]
MYTLLPGIVKASKALPKWYQIHIMMDLLNENLRKTTDQNNLLWILINDIVTLVLDEIDNLVKVEWSHPDLCRSSSLYTQPALIKSLSLILKALDPCVTICHNVRVNLKKLQSVLEMLPTYWNFLVNKYQLGTITEPPENAIVGERLSRPIHFMNGDIQEISFYDQKTARKAHAILLENIAQDNKWVHFSIQDYFSLYKYSQAVRMDGLPSVSEFSTPFKLHLSIHLKAQASLKTFDSISISFPTLSQEDFKRFILHHHNILSLIPQFLKENFELIFSLLPNSLQVEMTKTPRSIKGYLQHSLLCSSSVTTDDNPFKIKVSSRISLVFPEFFNYPIHLATQLINDSTKTSLLDNMPIQDIVQFYTSYFMKGLTESSITSNRSTLIFCETPIIEPSYQKFKNIIYPAAMRKDNPSHVVWPLCFQKFTENTQFVITTVKSDPPLTVGTRKLSTVLNGATSSHQSFDESDSDANNTHLVNPSPTTLPKTPGLLRQTPKNQLPSHETLLASQQHHSFSTFRKKSVPKPRYVTDDWLLTDTQRAKSKSMPFNVQSIFLQTKDTINHPSLTSPTPFFFQLPSHDQTLPVESLSEPLGPPTQPCLSSDHKQPSVVAPRSLDPHVSQSNDFSHMATPSGIVEETILVCKV